MRNRIFKTREIRNGNIGEPLRHIEFEPLEAPAEEPATEPAPAAPAPEPSEPVPA